MHNTTNLILNAEQSYNDAIQLEINVLNGINPINDVELINDYRNTGHKLMNKAIFVLFYSA